jgi:large repetitive protein
MSRRTLTLALAIAASLAAESPALAAISSPPAFPREITVFPERDFAVVDLWPANQDFRMDVLRNGVVIGTAFGTTDAGGLAEVNHPGGFCWTGFTPDILPGDTVQAVMLDSAGNPQLDGAGQPIGDATRSALLSAQPAAKVLNQLVIHGTARTPAGGQIPLGSLEQRIIAPDLVGLLGKRDIRAPGGGNGFTSTLSYDAAGSTSWTATYSGLSGAAMDAAAAGETRIMSWMATNAAGDRIGLTIFEAATLGGPGFGGCPLGASNAVVSPGVLNATTLAAGAPDVVFSGATQPDATGVDVTISDGSATVTRAATVTAGSWTAAVPAAELAGLADGTLTASGSYAVPGGTVTGSNLSVAKDTVLPDAPTANLGPGGYEGPQAIVLSSPDPDAQIHYTTNGSEPTPASPVTRGQLSVTSSQTIKAVAVDPAGNRSAVSSLGYAITPKSPLRIETPGKQLIVVQKPARTVLALRALSARKTITRSGLRRSGLRLGAELAKGTEVLRVRVYRGKRLITTAFRFPPRSGRYRVRLTTKKVKALAAGSYVLEVTPGTSRQNLGDPARATFRVVRR